MERSFRGCGKADPPEERLAKVVAGVRFVRLPKPYTYPHHEDEWVHPENQQRAEGGQLVGDDYFNGVRILSRRGNGPVEGMVLLVEAMVQLGEVEQPMRPVETPGVACHCEGKIGGTVREARKRVGRESHAECHGQRVK
eukprot:scaffold13273_cov34-Tisochrysis_lutea.AAC.2